MASLTQIAAKAGVSITAASLVLNKKEHGTRVSAQCAQRILHIAKELGYVPNYHASSIKKGRSDTIAVALDLGVVVNHGQRIRARSELAMPYFGLMLGGIEEVLRSRGLMITLVGPDAKNRAPDRALIGVRQRRFDGMIIMGTTMHHEEIGILAQAPSYPMVITEPLVETLIPSVDYDEKRAVELAVDHLAELGHRRLLWVGIERQYSMSTRPIRRTLFLQRCQELGLEGHQLHYSVPNDEQGFPDFMESQDAARIATEGYLATHGRNFTAVVAYNDLAALGVVDALADAGVQVPRDVSIVGHDDYEGRRGRPKLTSIDHRLTEMGRRAADLLVQMVGDSTLVAEYSGRRELVEPRLSIRGSAAAPR